jgi:phosphatidylglycerophosphate synthase
MKIVISMLATAAPAATVLVVYSGWSLWSIGFLAALSAGLNHVDGWLAAQDE